VTKAVASGSSKRRIAAVAYGKLSTSSP